MHRQLVPLICAFYLLSACHRLSPTEEKFVGTWSHSSMDATDFQVLGPDHSIIVFSRKNSRIPPRPSEFSGPALESGESKGMTLSKISIQSCRFSPKTRLYQRWLSGERLSTLATIK